MESNGRECGGNRGYVLRSCVVVVVGIFGGVIGWGEDEDCDGE